MTKSASRADSATSWSGSALDVLRGALIGTAETVPGVSGGTVALVVGVYDDVIASAGHVVSGVLRAGADVPRGRGWGRAAEEFRSVRWRCIVPLLLGMIVALALMAGLMEGLVSDYPVQMRALFFGLVLASLWVPFSLAAQAPLNSRRAARNGNRAAGAWSWRDTALALMAAVLAFLVVSLPPGEIEPTPLIIVLAAVVAVSALILPGLSGSFILLTIGLYEPTLSAVSDRNIAYLGIFLLGAVLGLASIVKLLQWLLDNRKRVTLVALTGVMAGSLRALWPWQDENRALLAPGEHLAAAVGLGVLGVAVVVVVLLLERWKTPHRRVLVGEQPEP